MPCLSITTNIKLSKESVSREQKELSQLTAKWLGKQEDYVMVILNTGVEITFAGSTEPTAYCEFTSLGMTEEQMPNLSKNVCESLLERFSIPQERVYIRFDAPPRSHFGWNGKTFG